MQHGVGQLVGDNAFHPRLGAKANGNDPAIAKVDCSGPFGAGLLENGHEFLVCVIDHDGNGGCELHIKLGAQVGCRACGQIKVALTELQVLVVPIQADSLVFQHLPRVACVRIDKRDRLCLEPPTRLILDHPPIGKSGHRRPVVSWRVHVLCVLDLNADAGFELWAGLVCGSLPQDPVEKLNRVDRACAFGHQAKGHRSFKDVFLFVGQDRDLSLGTDGLCEGQQKAEQ